MVFLQSYLQYAPELLLVACKLNKKCLAASCYLGIFCSCSHLEHSRTALSFYISAYKPSTSFCDVLEYLLIFELVRHSRSQVYIHISNMAITSWGQLLICFRLLLKESMKLYIIILRFEISLWICRSYLRGFGLLIFTNWKSMVFLEELLNCVSLSYKSLNENFLERWF